MGGGRNPAEMIVGMAVGGVIGRQMAETMNNSMQSAPAVQSAPVQGAAAAPVVAYYVAVNGKTTGPFDMNTLTQMAKDGRLVPQSQVWKQGMAAWATAGTVWELKGFFPPPVSEVPAPNAASGNPPQTSIAVEIGKPIEPAVKERTMHYYDEKNFYSTDRLIKFGMSTNVAQQMVESMNQTIRNMIIPGAGNLMQKPQSQQDMQAVVSQMQGSADIVYYAMIDGKQEGPFCETEIARLINYGKVLKDTFVWHTGLSEWTAVENIPAIIRLVALAPPPPPATLPSFET
jgi:hypothetical protein